MRQSQERIGTISEKTWEYQKDLNNLKENNNKNIDFDD
jgi:hypothetical protein